jgi:hypothetical protein
MTRLRSVLFGGLLTATVAVPLTATSQEPPKPRYLPAWAVRATAEKSLDEVHACYIKHVPAESRVGNGDNGRATFVFGPEGEVESVVWADTTVTQKSARDCMITALKQARAPIASERRTTVTVWIGLSSNRSNTTVKVTNDPNQRLTSSKVVETAKAELATFMKCYTDRLDSRPDLAGKVEFRLSVGADGNVSKFEMLQSLDAEVDACIERHARTLIFPAPGDDAPVIATIPITFQSK